MIVNLYGTEKSGKTHHTLTYPDPIEFFNFDLRLDAPLSKFPNKKVIRHDYPLLGGTPTDAKSSLQKDVLDRAAELEAKANPLYIRFLEEYFAALKDLKVKTIVIDTATQLWEIVRSAFMERNGLEALMPQHYGKVNPTMRSIYNAVRRPNRVEEKYLVVTHYSRDSYVGDKKTGEREADQFRHTPYLADLNLAFELENKMTKVTIMGCGEDRDLTGKTMLDPTFEDLVMVGALK